LDIWNPLVRFVVGYIGQLEEFDDLDVITDSVPVLNIFADNFALCTTDLRIVFVEFLIHLLDQIVDFLIFLEKIFFISGR
jgi:hypothetical protein